MSHTRKRLHKRYRPSLTIHRSNDYQLRPQVALPLFIVALCFIIFIVFVQQKMGGNGKAEASTASTQSAQCGVTGKPTCTPPEMFWANMHSMSATDIIAAAESTPMYQSAATSNDLIGNALQHGTIGTPVLVKPYRDDVGMPQKWVIPVVRSNGIPLALLTFVYDPVHQRIRASEFDAVTGNMFYTTHPFPSVNVEKATSIVSQQRHIHAQSIGTDQPTLIYYPSDHTTLFTQQNAMLSTGGTSVIDPIWRVTGSNGDYYYIDHIGQHAYPGSDLHTDPGFAHIPNALSEKQ